MSEQRVCSVDELPADRLRVVDIEGVQVALCRLSDGQVVAFEDSCTHDGAPFGDAQVDGAELRCPRHGARFDLRSGAALSAPATAPLERLACRVGDGGLIYVDVEALP